MTMIDPTRDDPFIFVANRTTEAGAIGGFIGWLGSLNWIGLCGVMIALLGWGTSLYFQRKRDRREQQEHELRVQGLLQDRRNSDMPVRYDRRRQGGRIDARIAVVLLSLSATGLGGWMLSEDFRPRPHIPTKGDVPTIGYGSTRYEDGRPVKLTDPAITRHRAGQLARNLFSQDEVVFRASLPGVVLYPEEYDLYLDFTGQFGIGNWRQSSMRRHLLAGRYRQACDALLMWRRQGGRDCSRKESWGPQGCKGVWTRQLERHAKCLASQ